LFTHVIMIIMKHNEINYIFFQDSENILPILKIIFVLQNENKRYFTRKKQNLVLQLQVSLLGTEKLDADYID